MPVDRLGANGELLLDRLLRETWERSLIRPGDPHNWTGTVLVDAQLCPKPRGFLRAYEDFRELLCVPTWNPVRNVPLAAVRQSGAPSSPSSRFQQPAELRSADRRRGHSGNAGPRCASISETKQARSRRRTCSTESLSPRRHLSFGARKYPSSARSWVCLPTSAARMRISRRRPVSRISRFGFGMPAECKSSQRFCLGDP